VFSVISTFALDYDATSIISFVNSLEDKTWTADLNSGFNGKSVDDVKKLLGIDLSLFNKIPQGKTISALEINNSTIPNTAAKAKKDLSAEGAVALPQALWPEKIVKELPESFDSREEWGSICPSIYDIRDQGSCGSCWASSFASTATDRICIASNGARKVKLATNDPLSCCGAFCGSGCNGGQLEPVWQYYLYNGVVSGGEYNDTDMPAGFSDGKTTAGTCWPYAIAPCQHHSEGVRPKCNGEGGATPQCRDSCSNSLFEFNDDKNYGRVAYSVPFNSKQIMAEIYKNGPVQAAFMVYADFPNYSEGVYKHVSGDLLGGHAVKIVGWGTHPEQGDYWVLANSWAKDWGKLGGFFLMARGKNECGIESLVYTGLPRL